MTEMHLTDVDLFGGAIPPREESGGPQKASVVLRSLMAANMRGQVFGHDLDDAERVWGAKIGRFSMDVLVQTVDEWISVDGAEFPAVAEFVTLADHVQRRVQEDERQRGLPPAERYICQECFGDLFVTVEDPETPAYTFVRPCSRCNLERYIWWRDGHANPAHLKDRCQHELCATGRGHRKRKAS